MPKEKPLDVGDIVDLTSPDDGIPFRTKIEDMRRPGVISAGLPSSGGLSMILHTNEELYLTFYRETGRYTIRVRVIGFDTKNDVRFVLLAQTSAPERDQRRMYFRLPLSVNVTLCEYEENIEVGLQSLSVVDEAKVLALETVGTRDLSITGVAIMSKNDYEMGSKFVLKLYFEEKPKQKVQPFVICAEIMRKEFDYRSGAFRLGMHFFGQTQRMSEFLAKYVLKQQQKQVAQRRLIEGN
ncbi:MAG: flagellar brake protein [Oscillospiraceae bacterium]|nr:flagellar brake protein [Oscillospiraceae bacterium]